MTFEDFKILVAKMRKAQKNYFKTSGTREPDAKKGFLEESKRLEKEVDSFLADSNPKLF